MGVREIWVPEGYAVITREQYFETKMTLLRFAKMLANEYGWSHHSYAQFWGGLEGRAFYSGRRFNWRKRPNNLYHFIDVPCESRKVTVGKTLATCVAETLGRHFMVGVHEVGCCPFKTGRKWRAMYRCYGRCDKD